MNSGNFNSSGPFSWFHFRTSKSPRESFEDDFTNTPFGFHDDMMTDMMQHLEDIFNNIGSMEFPEHRLDVPGLEPFLPVDSKSLRDQVLRDPESERPTSGINQRPTDDSSNLPTSRDHHPLNHGWMRWPNWWSRTWSGADGKTLEIDYPHRDKDWDGKVSDEDVSGQHQPSPGDNQPPRIVPRQSPGFAPNHWRSSFFYGESVSITRKADGTVEERRTVTDSDGNVKTSVTTKLPDGTLITGEQPQLQDSEDRSGSNLPILVDPHQKIGASPPKSAPLDHKAASIWKNLFGNTKS